MTLLAVQVSSDYSWIKPVIRLKKDERRYTYIPAFNVLDQTPLAYETKKRVHPERNNPPGALTSFINY